MSGFSRTARRRFRSSAALAVALTTPGACAGLAFANFRQAIQALFSAERPQNGQATELGTFATRAAAERHERAVQFFKRDDVVAIMTKPQILCAMLMGLPFIIASTDSAQRGAKQPLAHTRSSAPPRRIGVAVQSHFLRGWNGCPAGGPASGRSPRSPSSSRATAKGLNLMRAGAFPDALESCPCATAATCGKLR